MRDVYHAQLDELHAELKEMGALCQRAVHSALEAATTGNPQAVDKAQAAEIQIDHKERDIEALCMKLLLKQQPVAGELRDISAALKMITDLERIGDQASDIAEIAGYTQGSNGSVGETLSQMAHHVTRMVENSITSYIQRSLSLAREVMARDDTVDALFDRIKAELIRAIAADADHGQRWLDMLMVAKYLERIGDHATNVAEWAEYAITGKRPENGNMEA